MKFKVKTIRRFYEPARAATLSNLGFKFKAVVDSEDVEIYGDGSIDLYTMDEVVEFLETYGEVIWLDDTITLYDGYNE